MRRKTKKDVDTDFLNHTVLTVSSKTELLTTKWNFRVPDFNSTKNTSLFLGALIASSIFGITPIDVFDEIVTNLNDLNTFLTDNNCPKYSSYNGCLIKCFILLCKLTKQPAEKLISDNDAVQLYTTPSGITDPAFLKIYPVPWRGIPRDRSTDLEHWL